MLPEVRDVVDHLYDIGDAIYYHDVATRPDATVTVTHITDSADTTEEN